jgi:dedicator of cytokinesis protein 1
LLNIKEQHEQTKLIKNSIKDSFITIQVKCELLEAAYNKVFDQFTHFKPIFCRKMNFPEIIMPDDYRNDFYITVISGEFSKAKGFEFIANLVQFKKENDKNVEIGIDLDRDENDLLPQAKNYFLYKSIIYSKQEKPKWQGKKK